MFSVVRALDWLNRHGKAFAVRVRGVHPKHLVEVPGHAWYLEHIQQYDQVLDVGCGTGRHAFRIERHTETHVMGVDRPFFDAERAWTTLQSDWFGVVIMLDVLEHLYHRQHALREAYRVLKPGGRLLLAVPNSETPWRRRLREAGLFSYSDPDHKIEYTPAGIVDAVQKAGFTLQEMTTATYDTPWAGVMDALGSLWLPLYRVFSTWRHTKVYAGRWTGSAAFPPAFYATTGFRVVAVK